LTGGVDQHLRRNAGLGAAFVADLYFSAFVADLEACNGSGLAHFDALGGGILQKDVIELRPIHLERGRGAGYQSVGEGVAAFQARVGGHELGRVLGQKAVPAQRRHYPELLEQRHRARQQRLADVKARETLLLE
jgi:hypothetical protein